MTRCSGLRVAGVTAWICRGRDGLGYYACSCGRTVRVRLSCVAGDSWARPTPIPCWAYERS